MLMAAAAVEVDVGVVGVVFLVIILDVLVVVARKRRRRWDDEAAAPLGPRSGGAAVYC